MGSCGSSSTVTWGSVLWLLWLSCREWLRILVSGCGKVLRGMFWEYNVPHAYQGHGRVRCSDL
jgi:hypothetical protein